MSGAGVRWQSFVHRYEIDGSAPDFRQAWGNFARRTLRPAGALWLGNLAAGAMIVGPLDSLPAEGVINDEIADERTPVMNDVTQVWSTIGGTHFLILACLVVCATLLWRTRQWWLAVVPALALSVQSAVFTTASFLVGRSRPDVPHLDAAPPTSGFPSGHTGASTAFYLVMALLCQRVRHPVLRWSATAVCVLIPLLVAFSRLYRGMHHLTDVLAGLVNGIICAWLAWRYLRRDNSPRRTSGGAAESHGATLPPQLTGSAESVDRPQWRVRPRLTVASVRRSRVPARPDRTQGGAHMITRTRAVLAAAAAMLLGAGAMPTVAYAADLDGSSQIAGPVAVSDAEEVAAASSAPANLRVVQHNTDQDEARWNRVVRLAESGDWDAVTAQEVCSGWVTALRADHPAWTVAFHEQVAKGDCPGGTKGNAAIHPGPGSDFDEAFDVAGEGKNFGIACAVFDKGTHRVHACSTHFTVYDDNAAEVRLRQARRVKEITGEWIGRDHSVVVGGDLNTTPTLAALNPIYTYPDGRSNGRFIEAAQLANNSTQRVGADTVAGRKIDYVFFSANHTPLSAGANLTYEEPVNGKHKILKVKTTLH